MRDPRARRLLAGLVLALPVLTRAVADGASLRDAVVFEAVMIAGFLWAQRQRRALLLERAPRRGGLAPATATSGPRVARSQSAALA